MPWLQQIIENYPHLVYPLIFLIIIAEGDFFLLFLGFLVREKFLIFWKIYLIAVLAATLHDLFFWTIGRRLFELNRKKYLFINLEKIAEELEKIRANIGFFIFFSKFVWNLNRITLVSAGYLKTSFKDFIKYSFSASLIWPLVLLSLGYVFADQTEVFKQKFETASLIIFLLIVSFAAVQLWLKKIFQTYLLEAKKKLNGIKDNLNNKQ